MTIGEFSLVLARLLLLRPPLVLLLAVDDCFERLLLLSVAPVTAIAPVPVPVPPLLELLVPLLFEAATLLRSTAAPFC